MSKLLIIDKNVHLSKIKNNILQNNSNFNLFIVGIKNQESLNSLIKLCQNIQYNSTIVISNNTDIISKVMNSNLICNYLIQSEKKQNIDTQYNNIKKTCNPKSLQVSPKITYYMPESPTHLTTESHHQKTS